MPVSFPPWRAIAVSLCPLFYNSVVKDLSDSCFVSTDINSKGKRVLICLNLPLKSALIIQFAQLKHVLLHQIIKTNV